VGSPQRPRHLGVTDGSRTAPGPRSPKSPAATQPPITTSIHPSARTSLPALTRVSSLAGATAADFLEPDTQKGASSQARARKDNNAVNVSVRTRPYDPNRDGSDPRPAIVVESETEVRLNRTDNRGKDTQLFTFDNVFNAGQDEVFDCIGKPMLRNAFDGYNVTLFAYGQTGAGKTHSVLGPTDFQAGSPEEGFMYRFIRAVLGYSQVRLEEEDPELTIRVTLSMVEVYNEQVHDLLEDKSPAAQFTSLEVKESFEPKQKGAYYVKDMSIHTIWSEDRAQELVRKGFKARSVDAHNMNKESSRSHCVTVIRLLQTYAGGTKQNLDSVVYIVDLAGSENAERVGSAGNEKMAKEAKNINLSLTNLSIVLKHLSDKQPGKPPVRNSKLTQILANSFGGNARTWMLACLSPSMLHCAESASTLNFAASAKKIENNAKVNASLSGEEKKLLQQCRLELMQALERIKELEDENEMLRAKLEHRPPAVASPLGAGQLAPIVGGGAGADVFIGRCRMTLRNLVLGTMSTMTIPLLTQPEGVEGATVTLSSWVPNADDCSAPIVYPDVQAAYRALRGKRFDFCICVIAAENIPEPFTARVFCRYCFKRKENKINQTIDVEGTSNPRWEFRKRFAFPEFDETLGEHFCSPDSLIVEVIGYRI